MEHFLRKYQYRYKRIKPIKFYASSQFAVRREDRYLFCFFLGLIAGTIIVNFFYSSFANEAGYYLSLLDKNINLNHQESVSLFEQICRQRLIEAGIAWLIGMTVYAVPLFFLLTTGIGFSMGFILSVFTIQKGLLGLPVFLMTIFPQSLFYLPIGVILFLWGEDKERRFRIPAFLLLLLLVVLGSALEAWVNPLFLKIIL